MESWTWAWLAWGVVFGVIEFNALRSDRPNETTLSGHVWRFRDTVPFGRWALGGFLSWLVFHFMFG